MGPEPDSCCLFDSCAALLQVTKVNQVQPGVPLARGSINETVKCARH